MKEGRSVTKGDFVKVRLVHEGESERVWAEVLETYVPEQELLVRIDNYPVVTPFKYNETLRIPARFILDVHEERKT